MRIYSRILSATALSLLLTGCFTGIESTPKITADDVKKEHVSTTAEQQFLSEIRQEPFGQWQAGKQFHVTDNKISLIFNASSRSDEQLAGKILTYEGNRQVVSVTGQNVTELIFKSPEGKEQVYRIDASAEELAGREQLDIPFTIEASLIKSVRDSLLGKELYILTPVWYDSNEAITSGRKFVPVKITGVSAGNIVYPIMLTFTESQGGEYRLFMSVGKNTNATRRFASLFSFDDPHLKYPSISDETWQHIINGRVATDMTRDECRLSLGTPKSVDRRPGYGGVKELWIYEDGRYLMFEDGLLRSFRK